MKENLRRILVENGDKMDEVEAEMVLDECCDPEDEDGYVPYESK